MAGGISYKYRYVLWNIYIYTNNCGMTMTIHKKQGSRYTPYEYMRMSVFIC